MAEKKTKKADLHFHGPIGFQDRFQKLQGYDGKNLAKIIADTAFDRNVGLINLVSATYKEDCRGVDDRYGCLVEYSKLLPKDYEASYIGGRRNDVAFKIKKGDKEVIVVNGATMWAEVDGERKDHLVAGSNHIRNRRSLDEILKDEESKKVINGIEHMASVHHNGLGEAAERYKDSYDFVEWNAQLIFPKFLSFLKYIPVIGKYFIDANRLNNEKAERFAKKHNIPLVATSDAHRIDDMAIASISYGVSDLDESSPEKLIESLRHLIRERKYTNNFGYENPIRWFSWMFKSAFGCMMYPDELDIGDPSWMFGKGFVSSLGNFLRKLIRGK